MHFSAYKNDALRIKVAKLKNQKQSLGGLEMARNTKILSDHRLSLV